MKWMKPLTDLFKKKPEENLLDFNKAKTSKRSQGDGSTLITYDPPPPPLALVEQSEAKNPHKLTEDEREYVIDCMGRFMTDAEIHQEIKRLFNKTITLSCISGYRSRDKWSDKIKLLRQEYLSKVDEVPGAHKRVRLERAERVWTEAMKQRDLKTAVSSIRSQADEMNDQAHNQLSITFAQFNNMTIQDLQAEKLMIMEKLRAIDEFKKEKKDAE